ncbi:MAG TPA: SPOR domain-containing protein [Ramlibacter sp.]|jgi:hypothetical protein|uniref:SPOR domain-containing protein n=1 Tax=Ramlibacter sp. TaxID=1917967 RepID=UPI002D36C4B5|nr:SPOR domain-containing protein [Ramlibacter sp.]HZY17159.1 SPOR domain-containing protein [Ramlibacter sp.]
MLRLLVLLLLLANGTYYAWGHGLLQPWGVGPAQQSEPQRVIQQIRPDAVRVLPADEARRLETSAAKAPECLQAGLFEDPAVEPLRQVLATWPRGSWALEAATEPGRWIVYMGKYPDVEFVARKRAELRHLGVSFEAPANPQMEPGLSLGGFATQAEANEHLERLATRGVRTARVVQERPDVRGQRLTLAAVDDALRARLDELRNPMAGRALRPCH